MRISFRLLLVLFYGVPIGLMHAGESQAAIDSEGRPSIQFAQAIHNPAAMPSTQDVKLVSCVTPGGCATSACQSGCDIAAPSCSSCSPCGGCSSCSSCDGCGIGAGLLDFVAPSDRCFSNFLSPMTNPVYFEDPRTLTEARFIFLHHKVPLAAGGGDINLLALQLRAALTDRLSIIATKDGFATSTNPLVDDGWADVNAGLKYNLFKDACCQRILSAGATYELPVGSTRTLQGNGDGLFHLFLSGGARVGNYNWISGSGLLLPVDTDAESSVWYWSNHIDRRIGCTNLHALMELNWYHWMGSGTNGLPGVEGGDLFNLGSTGVSGNDIVTGAFGVKYKPSNKMEVGVAWEFPLTDRRDVLDNRLTVDCIFRY